jgi:hypothetical protein
MVATVEAIGLSLITVLLITDYFRATIRRAESLSDRLFRTKAVDK